MLGDAVLRDARVRRGPGEVVLAAAEGRDLDGRALGEGLQRADALGGDPRGWMWFVALPALLWAVIQVGADVRHYRAVFVRELAAPHLEGLRARGVDERRITWHVLRGAAAPVLGRVAAGLVSLAVGLD